MSPKQTNMIQDSRISVASRERQQETGFQFFMGIDQIQHQVTIKPKKSRSIGITW